MSVKITTMTAGTASRSLIETVQSAATRKLDTFQCVVTGTGATLLGEWESSVTDGATAVAFAMNTSVACSTGGMRLLSIRNNDVEKFAVQHDGTLLAGTIPAARMASTSFSGSIDATELATKTMTVVNGVITAFA